MAAPFVPVPRLWPESTIVILASGPSLSVADIATCRSIASVDHDTHILAIKDSVRLADWAEALYACDRRWWRAHPETKTYRGLKYGLEAVSDRPDVQALRNTGELGLELDPSGLRTGRNSGYQAINLAVHLGARRIVLLGYDMQPDAKGKQRWFGEHSYGGPAIPFYTFRERMPSLVEPLAALGVRVMNCTPNSALECFPRHRLDEVWR